MAIKKTLEMTDGQKELFSKLTPLQKKMVTYYIKGLGPSASHKKAGGKCKTEANRRIMANEILSKPYVKMFLESVREVSVNNAIMSRQEAIEILSNMARTATSDIIEFEHIDVETAPDKDGKVRIVKQTVWSIKDSAKHDTDKLACISEVSVGKDGLKIKTHDQKDAIKILSKLEGWDKPSEADTVERQKTQEERILEMAAAVKVAGSL